MSEELVLVVNGKPHNVQADPETPLLYVLRNELGLTGPQFGCGEENCGACMVLLGDQATPSCKLPVSGVGRSRVTTLEGLIEEGELHPAQQAFLDEQASQCGYCLNGMIMTVEALLRRDPCPTEQALRSELQHNLCRCGTHVEIMQAALRAVQLRAAGAAEDSPR